MKNKKENRDILFKIRFPEFRDPLTVKKLGDVAELIDERAGENKYILMSVTSGVGLVSQIDKFGREIAGNSLKKYLVIRKWDFAYNKSATKQYPEGYISMLVTQEEAAVPNSIFTCFRIVDKNVLPRFMDYMFHDNLHGKWLRKFIEVGARAHGSLSIDDAILFEMPIAFPSVKEQQKIADCLTSLDDLISAESQKLEALKDHKKGLMQNLFPAEGETVPKVRFPEFRKTGAWDAKDISAFAKVTTGNKDTQDKVDDGKYPFFVRSQSVERINSFTFDGEAILTSGDGVGVGKNYHYINGKFDFHQRVYCIFGFEKNVDGKFFYQYFSQHFYKRVMQLSAKNSVDSIRMAMITEMQVPLPCMKEQQKIAECLSSLDNLIAAQSHKIDALKFHKKGLMQQLFPSANEVVE